MKVDLSREDLLTLVKATKPNSMTECDNLTKVGKMKFTGNQHNENWEWTAPYLRGLSDSELWNLYKKHK